MKKNLPRPMFFPQILFIFCCCFCFSKAIDCGGNNVANTIVVDQKGKGGEFKTIQSAIDSIKTDNNQWIKIQINPGKYIEQVHIPLYKPCIILVGSNRKTTIVTYGDFKFHGLLQISTFTSSPPNVILSGITFENSYAYELKGPAPAATIYGDKTAIFKCNFLGYQDTLYDVMGRHYFKDCYIQGEIDFIFGGGQSYYEDCVMNATQYKSKPPGFVTAQFRGSEDDPSGFIFRRGFVNGIGNVDLGRAWGPYSRVIFWETYFSSVVLPRGWNAWNFVGHERNFTYAEVNCSGPGAKSTRRVNWVKKPHHLKLKDYNKRSFINKDKWLANIPTF